MQATSAPAWAGSLLSEKRGPPPFETVSDDGLVLRTEAGEVLKRRRVDGPWLPVTSHGNRVRGTLQLALTIASSTEKTERALRHFDDLCYTKGSLESKNSLFSTWQRIAAARGHPPVPLTCQCIREVTAILREAGYRAAFAYAVEATQRHARAGYVWSDDLAVALQDAKRAGLRALGPPIRAAEIKPLWWVMLDSQVGKSLENSTAPNGPAGGLDLWVVGTKFLLREVELSCLTYDCECVSLDEGRKVATLALPVSKADPLGRGARRSLGCNGCSGFFFADCPFHSVLRLVTLQGSRTGLKLADAPIGSVPLVGQKLDAFAFVDKGPVIAEAQRVSEVMLSCVEEARGLEVARVTGHFMRRSGAKELARKGVPFAGIQWLARHSSNVTWCYVEEALEEAPRSSLFLQGTMSAMEIAFDALQRCRQVEDAVAEIETKFKAWTASEVAIPGSCGNFKAEVRKAMIPLGVLNVSSQKVHAVQNELETLKNPKDWTTRCGWAWVAAGQDCQPLFEAEQAKGFRLCAKCARFFCKEWTSAMGEG